MRVAGIQETGGEVKLIDVPDPRPLAEDEVLIQVKAAGVADWDEIVRTGGWDVGCSPPMALGVEAAGTVAAVGREVTDSAVGDEVITHPLPLRDQGTWAPELIAPATLLAPKPAGVSWEAAAVFPVPALTAEQVLGEALDECCVVCKVKRGPSEFPVQRSFKWPNPSLPHSWSSWKRP